MKSRLLISFFIVFVLPFFLFGFGPSVNSHAIALKPTSEFLNHQLLFNPNYGQLPLAFEPNQGQIDSRVKFLARGSGYSLYLSGNEAVLTLSKPVSQTQFQPRAKGHPQIQPALLPPDVLRISLTGGNTGRTFEGMQTLPGVSNYFIGQDPSQWHTNISQYAKVQAQEVYPGVDMVYYGHEGHLEYDFLVKPGADPNSIHIKYDGADSAVVNAQGDLELTMGGRKVTFRSPTIYQDNNGQKNSVVGHYGIEADGGVHFEVKDYDKSKPLVIDPELDYSTYLGGSTQHDAYGIAVDGSGDAYVVGVTNSLNFPLTAGAYMTSFSGTEIGLVSEFNPTGTALLYSTYLGGSS